MNIIKSALLLILFSCCSIFVFSQTGAKSYEYPFLNPDLPLDKRAEDIVSRMTLEEKVSQMQHQSLQIERLGIPAYNWWNECLHGVGRSGDKVTVFPQAIAMAATFDPQAMERMSEITSDEARAIYYNAIDRGEIGKQYKGLTFWSPNINIFRDPRWGRGQETYGEDPYLTSVLGQRFVRGLQGDDPQRLKTSACAKHYAVHSGPEFGRHTFDVTVSTYDMWDTYLPAFHDLVVDANVSSVMCAYNRYAGDPCCGNDLLMTDILRNQWHFTGYVTSDCGAIDNFFRTHKTHPDAASASADAVKHGTDLDCGTTSYKELVNAVERGLIKEEEIDESLKRLFKIRFRLGMFDPKESDPYRNLTYNILESPSHKDHALKMARESMVLLKNNNILPLTDKYNKIVVMGPNADDEEVQLGNYNGFPSRIVTPLMGLKEQAGGKITYVKGTGHAYVSDRETKEAMDALKNADLVIFVGGISPRLEGEEGDAGKEEVEGFKGGDRTSIALPKVQTEMMKQIKAAGIPLVFVCMSGSAIGFEWEAGNADAILQAWYGGQSAGTAIADILFGKYNPSGRLPVTFYKNDKDLPHFHDYSMDNRTYKYFKGKALYPFGYGLSYSNFKYRWSKEPEKTYGIQDVIKCTFNIENTADIDGDEVAQVYIHYPQTGKRLPLKELRYFERLNIPKNGGSSISINVEIPITGLSKWNEDLQKMVVPQGEYRITIGGSSVDEALSAGFTIK